MGKGAKIPCSKQEHTVSIQLIELIYLYVSSDHSVLNDICNI